MCVYDITALHAAKMISPAPELAAQTTEEAINVAQTQPSEMAAPVSDEVIGTAEAGGTSSAPKVAAPISCPASVDPAVGAGLTPQASEMAVPVTEAETAAGNEAQAAAAAVAPDNQMESSDMITITGECCTWWHRPAKSISFY